MMGVRGLALAVCAVAAFAVQAGVAWRNLDERHHIAGRKASEGYLQGKVVLVYRGETYLPRLEHVWQSFKTKQFVIIGAGPRRNASCTFPQYLGAGLAKDPPDTSFYVVGETGRVVYRGEDDRAATEAVVTALTDMDSPRSLAQWREFLNFEFENLPAHAYLRFAEFKQKFPGDAESYADKVLELRAVKDVDKVAKLVALAKQAKDRCAIDQKKWTLRAKFARAIKEAIAKYTPLKDCEDPRLAQEAKNSLAELMWVHATL